MPSAEPKRRALDNEYTCALRQFPFMPAGADDGVPEGSGGSEGGAEDPSPKTRRARVSFTSAPDDDAVWIERLSRMASEAAAAAFFEQQPLLQSLQTEVRQLSQQLAERDEVAARSCDAPARRSSSADGASAVLRRSELMPKPQAAPGAVPGGDIEADEDMIEEMLREIRIARNSETVRRSSIDLSGEAVRRSSLDLEADENSGAKTIARIAVREVAKRKQRRKLHMRIGAAVVACDRRHAQ